MRLPARFLIALAQGFAAMGLYKEGHPARERAFDTLLGLALELQATEPDVEYTFLPGEVVWGGEPLWDLKGWEWAKRLSDVGIQRLAFTAPVTRDDLDRFLDEVMATLSGNPTATAEVRQFRVSAIQYGEVRLRTDDVERHGEGRGESEGEERGEGGNDSDLRRLTSSLGFTLREEVEAIGWIHEELKGRGKLHLLEAEAVVRSLSIAMHGDHQFLIPLLQLKRFDQYTTTHALNVSILSMALAEALGLGPKEVRDFGTSGLLHDLGKVTIPEEILNKPGKLTEEEKEIMNRHPAAGARMILETDLHLDLAAIVAYEHHIRFDGGGYPQLTFPRHCHQCSKLVHVCDVYDALRTSRPYRAPWAHGRILELIRKGGGSEFDPEIGEAFVRMMERGEDRLAVLEHEDEPLPIEKNAGSSGEGGGA